MPGHALNKKPQTVCATNGRDAGAMRSRQRGCAVIFNVSAKKMPRAARKSRGGAASGCQWPGCPLYAFTEVAYGSAAHFTALCREHRAQWEQLPPPRVKEVAWQSRVVHREHAKAALAASSGRRGRMRSNRPKAAKTSLGGRHS